MNESREKEVRNTDEWINKIIVEAIKTYEDQRTTAKRKKVFHNTKLLLAHYNDLKAHVNNAIDDAKRLENDLIDLDECDRDELYILSIKRSKAKSLIMIAHIDMALEVLKKRQYKLCATEKYEALRMFYIYEMTYEEIQTQFNCSKNTPRRWINEMVNELSILLFGIDGLKIDVG